MGPMASKLAEIGALPFPQRPFNNEELASVAFQAASNMLAPLLALKNGFLAFESALQVYGLGVGEPHDIASVNEPARWTTHYADLAGDLYFFAQDLFGGQYAVEGAQIVKFDPELGERSFFAASIEDWAGRILRDYDYETGFTIAHEWQQRVRPLKFGERLYPKVPFVLGGEFELDNLWPATPQAMHGFRGFLAQRLHGLPDGTKVRLNMPDGHQLVGCLQR